MAGPPPRFPAAGGGGRSSGSDGYAFASSPISLVFVESDSDSALRRDLAKGVRIQAAGSQSLVDIAARRPDLVLVTLAAAMNGAGTTAEADDTDAPRHDDHLATTFATLRHHDSHLPIFLLLEPGDHSASVVLAALAAGATDLVDNAVFDQPGGDDVLRTKIVSAFERRRLLRRPAVRLHVTNTTDPITVPPAELIGTGPAMHAALIGIAAAGRDRVPVLIHGEPGTGKSLAAMTLHHLWSGDAADPVVIDFSQIVDRGTDRLFQPDRDSPELLASIAGKTVVVENLDHASPLTQSRLLAWLRHRESHAPGVAYATDPRASGQRMILTCSRPLADCRNRRLIDGLYYTLAASAIEMPPLRDRGHDLLALAEHFIRLITGTTPVIHGQQDHRITPTAMRQLQRYDWPGNLTELRSVIAAELRLGSGGIVENERLSKLCAHSDPLPKVRDDSGPATGSSPDVTSTSETARAGNRPPSEPSADNATVPVPDATKPQSRQPGDDPLLAMRHPAAWSPIVDRMLRRESPDDEVPSLHSDAVLAMEYGLVASVLEKTDGNLAQSARLLGITRVSLRRKIQALGLKIPGRNFD